MCVSDISDCSFYFFGFLAIGAGCLYTYCAAALFGIDYSVVCFFCRDLEMENEYAHDCDGWIVWFFAGIGYEISG